MMLHLRSMVWYNLLPVLVVTVVATRVTVVGILRLFDLAVNEHLSCVGGLLRPDDGHGTV